MGNLIVQASAFLTCLHSCVHRFCSSSLHPECFSAIMELVKVDNWGRCCALSHLMCQLSLQHCHHHLGGPFKLSNSLAHSTLLRRSVYASLSSSPPPRHPPVSACRMHRFVSFELWWQGAKGWMVKTNKKKIEYPIILDLQYITLNWKGGNSLQSDTLLNLFIKNESKSLTAAVRYLEIVSLFMGLTDKNIIKSVQTK